MKKGYCKYCEKKLLDSSNIRCHTCDIAWQDGHYSGTLEVKGKLNEMFKAFKRFVED